MGKSTYHLPDDLKTAIKRSAAEHGVSESEFVRQALWASVAPSAPNWDLLPTIHSPELAALGDEEDFLTANGFDR
ncbi:ribbon-helix-helix domain-containing protein [Glycomyces sp. A-F 0318]|uniref:ribbon-helix-helix domain-containing protein n=1 Tax=Glycomyces amatae TaxID=2881355 RepID=UPI001E459D31|nr:CopG family transcriptional regulator [Glycomyces amatae]MCD0445572.1 ribbon-helix-helix domain-containing protein [Glycomyces amatae]